MKQGVWGYSALALLAESDGVKLPPGTNPDAIRKIADVWDAMIADHKRTNKKIGPEWLDWYRDSLDAGEALPAPQSDADRG